MTLEALPALALGFLLGVAHALEADHVVAVSTLASRVSSLRAAARLGVVWGLGHTAALLAAGAVVLGLRLQVPARLEAGFELLVGGVLVALGLRVLRGYRRQRVHVHTHAHRGASHLHFHAHGAGAGHDHEHPERSGRATFLVGMAHGLAGSAALLLLVATRFDSIGLGLLFIALFGAGSVLAMGFVSAAVAVPFAVRLAPASRLAPSLRLLTGVLSVGLGLWMLLGPARHVVRLPG